MFCDIWLLSSPLPAKNSLAFSKIKRYKYKQRHLWIGTKNSFQNEEVVLGQGDSCSVLGQSDSFSVIKLLGKAGKLKKCILGYLQGRFAVPVNFWIESMKMYFFFPTGLIVHDLNIYFCGFFQFSNFNWEIHF